MGGIPEIYVFEFVWDKSKAETNLSKHGISYETASGIFHDPLALSLFDKSHSLIEDRWLTLGKLVNGKLIVVSHTHTELAHGKQLFRLISARFATRTERLYYENEPRQGDHHVH